MRARQAALLICAAMLAACDPGVHIGWEKDFDGPLDYDCIENALRTVAPDVRRTTWVDGGFDTNGFPRGTEVTQFKYDDPVLHNWYSLNVALLKNGKTRYEHHWSMLGTAIPVEDRRKILPLLNRANEAVSKKCGLSFVGIQPTQGAG